MERLSVFNFKGGSGKTTISVLLSSYLAYHLGKRVLVIDLDYPEAHFSNLRLREEKIIAQSNSYLCKYVLDHATTSVYKILALSGRMAPSEIIPYLQSQLSMDYDYIIFDFKGDIQKGSLCAQAALAGLLDRVFIPIQNDHMSISASITTAQFLRSCGVKASCFWNNLNSTDYTKSRLEQAGGPPLLSQIESQIRASSDTPFCSTRIKNFVKASRLADGLVGHLSSTNFVLSTLCWPEKNVERNCPALPLLFDEFLR